jgi:hypothetical protein
MDIKKILNLPDVFRSSAKSLSDIVEQTGCSNVDKELNELEIENEILKDSSIVEKWLEYSQNKRTGQGWYVVLQSEQWVVGYLDVKNKNLQKKFVFENVIHSMSFFIKKELQEILYNQRQDNQ